LQHSETVTYGIEAAGALIASVLCLSAYTYWPDCDLPNMQDALDMDSSHKCSGKHGLVLMWRAILLPSVSF
jgi:hypothetical protein